MAKVGTTYVPAEGREDAKIMVVGEAPGGDEEREKRPFIGASGQLLQRYLGRHRVRRQDVYLTNLCKFRPYKNRFMSLLEGVSPGDELRAGLEELEHEIATVRPNIIIGAGNWPMYFLTGATGSKGQPGTGIMNWRGSVIPTADRFEGYKCLVTFHPAFIVRPNGFNWNPVFHFDIGKAVRESSSRDFNYPTYQEFIDPDDGTLQALIDEMLASELISVDIETFGDSLACVGFTSSTEWGLCLTCDNPAAWEISEQILASDTPKLFQFGVFDINYLNRFYGWEINGYGEGKGWDTYIASATLMPEFPRGLDFMTSVYTDFPYYKEERKTWKETEDKMTLWKYNIKDVVATLMIAQKQQEEARQLFKS